VGVERQRRSTAAGGDVETAGERMGLGDPRPARTALANDRAAFGAPVPAGRW
jgi:hypothetical protein